MDYQELIERMRGFEIDHSPDGWPAIRMREISAMCDAIESLLVENERLKHNLTSTEQTMREYQELAAKRLEEIDRLKDERESHGPEGRNYTNLQVVEMRQKFTERINEQKAELAKYRDAPVVASAAVSNSSDTFRPIIKFDYGVELRMAVPASGKPIALIVKPGE